jgi:hypothetical protein
MEVFLFRGRFKPQSPLATHDFATALSPCARHRMTPKMAGEQVRAQGLDRLELTGRLGLLR